MRNGRSITWWIAFAPTRRRLQNAIRAITPSSGTGGGACSFTFVTVMGGRREAREVRDVCRWMETIVDARRPLVHGDRHGRGARLGTVALVGRWLEVRRKRHILRAPLFCTLAGRPLDQSYKGYLSRVGAHEAVEAMRNREWSHEWRDAKSAE